MNNAVHCFLKAVMITGLLALSLDAASAREESQEQVKTIELYECEDAKLGIRFYCDPDWELETDEGVIFVVMTREPLATLTVAASDSPVLFDQQVNRPVIKEIGQYADGFTVERGVSFAGKDAVLAKGVAGDRPDTRLHDFYVLHDLRLYTVMFAVRPKEQWEQVRPLMEKIVESFRFVNGEGGRAP